MVPALQQAFLTVCSIERASFRYADSLYRASIVYSERVIYSRSTYLLKLQTGKEGKNCWHFIISTGTSFLLSTRRDADSYRGAN